MAIHKSAPRSFPDAYYVDKGDYCIDCRRCEEVWPTGAVDLEEEAWDEEMVEKVKRLMTEAKVPRNAAVAFWRYSDTQEGRALLRRPQGWQRYAESYLAMAFGKKTPEDE